jgi:hypothetical protein
MECHALLQAARKGHLEITKYLWENNCDLLSAIFLFIAIPGNLEIFEFFEEKELLMSNPGIVNSETAGLVLSEALGLVLSGALIGRSENILGILRTKYFRGDSAVSFLFKDVSFFEERYSKDSNIFNEDFFMWCGAAGRLDILQAAQKINPEGPMNFSAIVSAVLTQEDKEILKWVVEESPWVLEESNNPVAHAARIGKHELVTWMLDNGYTWTPEVATAAASCGCVEIIKVLFLFPPSLHLTLPPLPSLPSFLPSSLPPYLPSSLPPFLLKSLSLLPPASPLLTLSFIQNSIVVCVGARSPYLHEKIIP